MNHTVQKYPNQDNDEFHLRKMSKILFQVCRIMSYRTLSQWLINQDFVMVTTDADKIAYWQGPEKITSGNFFSVQFDGS